jgi:hypothetical protein
MQDLRLHAEGHGEDNRLFAYQPSKLIDPPDALALQAIATHMQQLTCLGLPHARLCWGEVVEPLANAALEPLAGMTRLRALGLNEADCSSPAALRKQLGLPGPINKERWLSVPTEGW